MNVVQEINANLLFQVKKKYQNMPFNLRNFEEEAKAKMGVVECVSHKLIEPFQVLYEKHSKYHDNTKTLFSKDNSMTLSPLVEVVSRHFARTNFG